MFNPDLQPRDLHLSEPGDLPPEPARSGSSASPPKATSSGTGGPPSSPPTCRTTSGSGAVTVNAGLRYEYATMPLDTKGRDINLQDLLDPQVTVGPLYENPTGKAVSPRVGRRLGRAGERKDVRAGRVRHLLRDEHPAEPHRHGDESTGDPTARDRESHLSDSELRRGRRALDPALPVRRRGPARPRVEPERAARAARPNRPDPGLCRRPREEPAPEHRRQRAHPDRAARRVALLRRGLRPAQPVVLARSRRRPATATPGTTRWWPSCGARRAGDWASRSRTRSPGTSTPPRLRPSSPTPRTAPSPPFRSLAATTTRASPTARQAQPGREPHLRPALRARSPGSREGPPRELADRGHRPDTAAGRPSPRSCRRTGPARCGRPRRRPGIGFDRPDLAEGRTSESAVLGKPEQWFDPTAFVLQPAGQLGNLGRGTLVGPDLKTVDLALLKRIPWARLGNGGRVELRVEAFNVFNRANFGIPSLNRFCWPARRGGAARHLWPHPLHEHVRPPGPVELAGVVLAPSRAASPRAPPRGRPSCRASRGRERSSRPPARAS